MHGDVLVAIVTFLLVIVTAASIYTTLIIAKNQEKLQNRLSNEEQNRHEEQRRFEQRSLIIPLWQYMANLREIDPREPATSEVLKIVNTLELIALCREAGIVDETVILRTFRDKYISLYGQVSKCVELKGYSRPITGQDLLKENPAATRLYDELMIQRNSRDIPPPL
ncbi:hypothetical protein HJB52_03900 [Rhizobium lentis]|uniref:DUF4760 domain-containing protein n=1 Tax=Rhizobium lentis TaxID=1138194 RepID=UPI001C831086|nr:hypothetical protein [Rhizobium lentis]MBX5101022.1 hypothetical protein [Rhizobium lentis]